MYSRILETSMIHHRKRTREYWKPASNWLRATANSMWATLKQTPAPHGFTACGECVNGPCTLPPEQSCKAGRQSYGLSVSCQLEANRNGFLITVTSLGELQHLHSQFTCVTHTHTQSRLLLRNHTITSITVRSWSTEMHHSPVNRKAQALQVAISGDPCNWLTSAQNPAFSGHRGTNWSPFPPHCYSCNPTWNTSKSPWRRPQLQV